MEAGLIYTAAGPWLAAVALLALVFAAFRHPVGGTLGYVGLVYAAPYFTYRDELQAIAAAAGALVLAASALIRRPLGRASRPSAPDWAMLAFTAVMVIAAWRGHRAGHLPSHVAADVYHYLLIAPALYLAGRRLVPHESVPGFQERFVWLSALFALPALAVVALASETELVWLVGAPLEEGGVRLKPDFAYPLVPAVLGSSWLLARVRPGWLAACALLVASLVLTYKRTYWMAALSGVTASFLLALARAVRRRETVAPIARAVILGAAAVGGGVGIAMLGGLNAESAAWRTSGLARPASVPTLDSRRAELGEVLRHVRAAPLGYGLGAAPVIPYGDPEGVPTHYTHTIYLQWCLQGGLPAGISAVALLGIVLARLGRRAVKRSPDVRTADTPGRIACGAQAAALLALAVAGLALQSLNSPVSALMVGLAANLASPPGRARAPASPASRG